MNASQNHPKPLVTSRHSARSSELEKYLSLVSILRGYEEFVLDGDGKIVSSNLEAVNITGYEEHEVIGQHISLFYGAEEKEKAIEDLRKAAALKCIIISGIRLKKRGTSFWAKMKINYLDHPKTKFKVTLQDNTHRKLSKLRMQSFRDEFLTIFNNPFIGTFKYKRSSNRVLMCNQKTLDITDQNDSTEIYFNSFFGSRDQWAQFNALLEKDKKVEGFQFIIKNYKNNYALNNWGLISAHVLDRMETVGGVIMDISEQYQQLNELQRVNTELENFVYHSSHDLRAPLTTIVGLTNLGERETSAENSKLYFEMIRKRTIHLDNLLKDLALISQNSKERVNADSFDFQKEVELLFGRLRQPNHSVEIIRKFDQQHPFMSDAIRLRTILRNLISNSLKYTHPEKKLSTIKIKVKTERTHAAIMIRDNGIGIEHAHKEQVFNMFFRATTESTGGGLGLYIVKLMMEKIRGKILVESTPFCGTTFLLIIPNMVWMKLEA